jgi:hypothetical protein
MIRIQKKKRRFSILQRFYANLFAWDIYILKSKPGASHGGGLVYTWRIEATPQPEAANPAGG